MPVPSLSNTYKYHQIQIITQQGNHVNYTLFYSGATKIAKRGSTAKWEAKNEHNTMTGFVMLLIKIQDFHDLLYSEKKKKRAKRIV